MVKSWLLVVCFTLAVVGFALPCSAHTRYRITDLGKVADITEGAFDINNAGTVVGVASSKAFMWKAGVRSDLDAWANAGSGSIAVEGNESDEAVGTASTAGFAAHLTTFQAGHANVDTAGKGDGYGINNLGFVVGTRDGQGILKDPTTGAITALSFTPNAVNDSNHVVGNGVLWIAGQFTQLGTLGLNTSNSTTAIDINEQDVVVGRSFYVGGAFHAFRWDRASGMHDLGDLGGNVSSANHVNALGEIVGYSLDATSNYRAVLWTATGELVDLTGQVNNLTGWNSLAGAWGNNDQGAIVGVGLDSANVKRAFLLTPDVPKPVPALPDMKLPFFALLVVGVFAARKTRPQPMGEA